MNTSGNTDRAYRKRRRSPAEIERDRRRISDMYLRGILQHDIAEQVGLSQSTVSRHLTQLQEEWLRASIDDIGKRKAIEIAKIDQLERVYYDAWERSRQPFISKTLEGRGTTSVENKAIKQTVKNEERVGDPRYLDGVMDCIRKRCELLGLDEPAKTDITSGGEKILVTLKSRDDTDTD